MKQKKINMNINFNRIVMMNNYMEHKSKSKVKIVNKL